MLKKHELRQEMCLLDVDSQPFLQQFFIEH